MDLEQLSKDGNLCLLKLPRSDLQDPSTTTTKSLVPVNTASESENHKDNDDAPLLLLQLPPGWNTEDLKGSTFVANDSQQAALVVESKQQSFHVHRAETSNVLALVPPLRRRGQEPQAKKLKTDDKALLPIPTRLLKKGGSGASFLELRPKSLTRQELAKSLQPFLWNPYTSSALPAGKTLVTLSQELQVSQHQIHQGLVKLQALPLPNPDASAPIAFGLLAEEAKLICLNAILFAIMEEDAYQDYAYTGFVTDELVTHALTRLSEQECFHHAEHVIRFCLRSLLSADYAIYDNDLTAPLPSEIELDVQKVCLG